MNCTPPLPRLALPQSLVARIVAGCRRGLVVAMLAATVAAARAEASEKATVGDYSTEQFESGFDLAYTTLTFTPEGAGFSRCRAPATALPTDPAGGTALPLEDEASLPINLISGKRFPFFGSTYAGLYVGSNGYLTFGASDDAGSEDIDKHFALPRVSALFDDLDPGLGGGVSWRQLNDRVAVTYQAVAEWGLGGANTFQVELLFNGVIRITYLAIGANDAIVGLSPGQGRPLDFVASDLTDSAICSDSLGTLTLNKSIYGCRDAVTVTMHDGDLVDTGSIQLEIVTASGDHEWASLLESPSGSGTFTATLASGLGTMTVDNGVIEFGGGDTLTASYLDLDDGTGNPAAVTATAQTTCMDDVVLFTVGRTAGTPRFYKFAPLLLADSLASSGYSATAGGMLGAVAHVPEATPLATATLYREYRLRVAADFPPIAAISDIHIANRCHEAVLQTQRATAVLISASIASAGGNTGGSVSDAAMTCYKVRVLSKLTSGELTPDLPDGMQINLMDTLNATVTRRYDLLGISRLCVPTAVSGSPVYATGPNKGLPKPLAPIAAQNPNQALVCYRAALARKFIPQSGCVPLDPTDRGTPIEPSQAKHIAIGGVSESDPFGTAVLDTSREREVCIPSVLAR